VIACALQQQCTHLCILRFVTPARRIRCVALLRGRSDVATWLKEQLGLGRQRFRQPTGGFDNVEQCVEAACIHPLPMARAQRHHLVRSHADVTC